MSATSSRYTSATDFTVEDPRRGFVRGVGLIYEQSPIINYRPYQVQVGDRWDTIAGDVFNDPSLWWRIADFNPELFDPRALRPGVMIRLPLLT